ncbi:MAG TPA: PaaI family thioesterase [Lentimicrobium sp.]|jgi:uncharacterized protein (TIGR00369 family)|nr:PaaI family thioesterase [Lentimicrobium sp.]
MIKVKLNDNPEQVRKLKNPFVVLEGYNCFGCSPGNPSGLQMKFTEEGEEVVARWEPKPHFQGWKDVLHGGIQAALMDEIASWLVFTRLATSGVTSKMEVRLKKPVYTNRGTLTLRARLKEMNRNIALIDTRLFDQDMVLCAEAVMHYFTFSPEKAREKLWYPGKESFYEEP